jgi:hypothetical protein
MGDHEPRLSRPSPSPRAHTPPLSLSHVRANHVGVCVHTRSTVLAVVTAVAIHVAAACPAAPPATMVSEDGDEAGRAEPQRAAAVAEVATPSAAPGIETLATVACRPAVRDALTQGARFNRALRPAGVRVCSRPVRSDHGSAATCPLPAATVIGRPEHLVLEEYLRRGGFR